MITTTENPILKNLGLTPDAIRKYVVSIAPPYRKKFVRSEGAKRRRIQQREARKAAGQNVLTGLPLQRSPNGTRQDPYARKNEIREIRRLAGLNVLTGEPLKRHLRN